MPSVVALAARPLRVSMFLWGLPGCGKTHFAGTAPGKRLWINFDPEGTASLPTSEDTLLMDFANEPPESYMKQVQSLNPFDLEGIFKQHPDIQTVVVDSITRFVQNAVTYSIGRAPGSTFENPGKAGYGYRSRFTMGLVHSLLYVTGKHDKHMIFIGHEGPPLTNEAGVIQAITIMLGGQMDVGVPMQISEVWHMQERNLTRYVQVRQVGLHKPMKTRMFDASKSSEFTASDAKNPSIVNLAALFQQWKDGNYNKLELPK